MAEGKKVWSDERVEQIIGNLLRTGVILAALWVFIGGALYLARYSFIKPNYHVFRGEPTDLRHVSGIVRDVLGFGRRSIIQFGLLLMIGTPIARVAFSIFSFAKQHDWVYVAVTFIVFVLLLYGLSGGHL